MINLKTYQVTSQFNTGCGCDRCTCGFKNLSSY